MKVFKENSIAKKLMLYIVIFSSVVTLFLTAIQLYRDYLYDLNSLKNRMSQLEQSHLDGLTLALWNMDEHALKTQLLGALQMQDVEYLEIKDTFEKNKVLISVGEELSKKTIKRVIPLLYFNNGKSITLGTLRVVASLDNIYQHLLKSIFVIVVSNTIKTFLVSLFIFFIFQRLIGKKLSDIASSAENLHLDPISKKREEIITKQSGKMNELDRLVLSINKMRERMQDDAYNQKLLAMGTLTAQVAHDLRSPLSSMQMAVRGLEDLSKQTQVDMGDYLLLLQMSARRLGTIANDLLSKHKGMEDKKTIFSLHAVLDELIGEYQSRSDLAGIVFEKQYNNRGVDLYGSRVRLQRAVGNIIKNAREAMRNKGKLTFTITQTQSHVALSIKDNGPGMAPDLLEKVLKGAYTHGKVDGHGIGMQVVREAVAEFCGELTCESVLNCGTTFTLTLPLPSREQKLEREDDVATLKSIVVPVRRGESVIVVDDEASMREQWRILLDEQGTKVQLYSCYEDIENWSLLTSLPSTAIVDYHFTNSRRNGFDVANLLQKRGVRHLILCTAEYWKPHIQEQAKLKNMQLCPKPVPERIIVNQSFEHIA